jgi:endonuclease/exonuclease/phosphatase family metal-dependent hydrolase
MRVMTWNVFHGRARPPARRSLLRDYTATIAGWQWDVALLQEVPPWWPPELARGAGADHRLALTSRNELLPVRRFIAERWPDIIKSHGGGSNAILVRGQRIVEHRTLRLRRFPERRVMHAVLLERGVWVGNLHAQAHATARARADTARAAGALLEWSAGRPALLGGDFNDQEPRPGGFASAGGRNVDHLLVHGARGKGPPQPLSHVPLSDHAPLVFEVAVDGEGD